MTVEELNGALFGEGLGGDSSGEGGERRPLFGTGDSVRVRSFRRGGGVSGGIEWRRPHVRVPGYIYGTRGVVERVCSEHEDPSFLAFGLDAPKVRLYRVRFQMQDIWPERRDKGADDVVEVEVYEPWLEASTESSGHDFEEGVTLFDHSKDGSDCADDTGHHRSHGHEHNHSHDPRPLVEERAAQSEGESRPGKELYSALSRVLVDKGIVTPAQTEVAI